MADGFDDFCRGILNRPTWPGALAPAALAEEFVRHFGLGGFPRFQHLEKVLHGVSLLAKKAHKMDNSQLLRMHANKA